MLIRSRVLRKNFQRRAVGGDRLLEPRRPALPLAKALERSAEIVLRLRPVERAARSRVISFSAAR